MPTYYYYYYYYYVADRKVFFYFYFLLIDGSLAKKRTRALEPKCRTHAVTVTDGVEMTTRSSLYSKYSTVRERR